MAGIVGCNHNESLRGIHGSYQRGLAGGRVGGAEAGHVEVAVGGGAVGIQHDGARTSACGVAASGHHDGGAGRDRLACAADGAVLNAAHINAANRRTGYLQQRCRSGRSRQAGAELGGGQGHADRGGANQAATLGFSAAAAAAARQQCGHACERERKNFLHACLLNSGVCENVEIERPFVSADHLRSSRAKLRRG